jgi:hypothetical protein
MLVGAPDRENLLQAMKILIDHGASVNLQNGIGITPLMFAVHRARCCFPPGSPLPEIKTAYDVLLSATNPKPDFELRNIDGETALGYLARWGEFDTMQRLISLGADIYTVDDLGTNLFVASASASLRQLSSLLALVPADRQKEVLEKPTLAGSTAVYFAASRAKSDIVDFLVNQIHVKTDGVNNAYETALSSAKDKLALPRLTDQENTSYQAIVKTLEGAGASSVPPIGDLVCNGPNSEPMSFDKVKALVGKCGVTSVDGLLPLLPVSQLSNYLLSYSPRGFQGGSFERPRVVTLGQRGEFILTFSGDSNLQGYDTVEMLEFKERQGQGPASVPSQFELREISFAGGTPVFSEANPAKCTTCHGKDFPKPRWDNWYLWPGFYNSEQASMFPIEKGHYKDFLVNRTQGRYAFLKDQQDSPYVTREGFFDYANFAANIKMDAFTQDLTSEVVTDQLTHAGALQKFKYAIFGALSCGGRIEDFLPQKVNQAMPRTFDDILKETETLDFQELSDRVKRQAAVLPGSPEGNYSLDFIKGIQTTGQSYSNQKIARLRYLIEGLGLPMDWSTLFTPGKNTYVFQRLELVELKLWRQWLDPQNAQEAPVYSLYQDRYKALPFNINDYYGMFAGADYEQSLPGVDNTAVCAKLKDLSLAALGP